MQRTPPDPPPFELSSGELCLDFANTWGDRGRPETDRLKDYGALLAFARQAAQSAGASLDRVERAAKRDPARARRCVARALELREAIARIFTAEARGLAQARGDLETLNRKLSGALARLRIERGGEGWLWGWESAADDLDSPLWPIARSAAELLTSDRLGRVRECDGADCTWLFLDTSRSRSRRWCSMESCGNRAKARRHYRRRKGS